MINTLKKELTRIRLAISFLSLLPIAPQEPASEEDWGRTVKYFPAVGIIFAALNILIVIIFSKCTNEIAYINPWLFSLAIVLAHIFMSGGLHIDGLMDSFDGIAASKKTVEETSEVMKDSRAGAFAAMAGNLIIISKIILISQLIVIKGFNFLIPYLILIPLISRALTLIAILYQPVQSINRFSANFQKHSKKFKDTIFALAPLAIASAYIVKLELINIDTLGIFIALSLSFGFLAFCWLAKKLYGHSGDSYGAGLELSEIICLLICFAF